MAADGMNMLRGREQAGRLSRAVTARWVQSRGPLVLGNHHHRVESRDLDGCIPVRCDAGIALRPASGDSVTPQPQDGSRNRERATNPVSAINGDASGAEPRICPEGEGLLAGVGRGRPTHSDGNGRSGAVEFDGWRDRDGSPPNGEPSAAMLMRLAGEARILRGLDNRFYAEVPADGHCEIHELGSPAFEYWLSRRFRQHRQTLPTRDGFRRLIRALEADAMAAGPAEAVWVRLAGGSRQPATRAEPVHDARGPVTAMDSAGASAGAVFYLDLGNASCEAVEIRAEGCRIVSRAPVLFRRPRGLHPLPKPRWDGSIDLLKRFTNVADADFPLLVAWLTAALRPVGPYPVLILSGEQGSAKSTMARVARRLIDPSSAPLRALPANQRDFMIEAHNTWVLAYDNVSAISTPLSDALCRIATGGGFSTRRLFSDHDNTLFDVQRPVLFTGVDDFVHRSDLIDRCIFLHLPAIPDEKRRLEETFWEDFETDYPRLLGALLTAVSAGLRFRQSVKIPALPRMADFAHWGEAVARGLGWAAGSFLAQYKANRREACVSALDDCAVAEALRALVDSSTVPCQGTASELLALLAQFVPWQARRATQWPKNARLLSTVLRRIAPQLRMIGIIVEFERGRDARLIRISSDAERAAEARATCYPPNPPTSGGCDA